MFTRKEIELLQIVVYGAYKDTQKRKKLIEEALNECKENALYNIYCDEMAHYIDITLKLGKLLNKME